MPRFRKKPVIIDAIQWLGNPTIFACAPFDQCPININIDKSCEVMTLEGPLTASLGDYIIRGVKGEFYPCKPDIFAATYEAVDGNE